jgi:hypothetical protein
VAPNCKQQNGPSSFAFSAVRVMPTVTDLKEISAGHAIDQSERWIAFLVTVSSWF